MISRVRKAVFPAAGLGLRFLPATRAIPKAMLTVVDKPVIQYGVEEARAAGIDHFIFIVAADGSAIEKHFDPAPRIGSNRRNRGRGSAQARATSNKENFVFVRQPSPLGLGHAIWCARDQIGDEPFAIVTPDVITRGDPGCLVQILTTYYAGGSNVLSVQECRSDETHRYGIVGIGERISDAAFRITELVEKPSPETAPSNLKISGRYVLQPHIFDHLAKQEVGVGGEVQLTDALVRLAEEQPIFGHHFRGQSFDCGSKEGFIAANVAFALDDPKLAGIVRRELDQWAP